MLNPTSLLADALGRNLAETYRRGVQPSPAESSVQCHCRTVSDTVRRILAELYGDKAEASGVARRGQKPQALRIHGSATCRKSGWFAVCRASIRTAWPLSSQA
jgi:hypothetical protein